MDEAVPGRKPPAGNGVESLCRVASTFEFVLPFVRYRVTKPDYYYYIIIIIYIPEFFTHVFEFHVLTDKSVLK